MFSGTVQSFRRVKAAPRMNRTPIFHRQQRRRYYRPLAATEYRVSPADESTSKQLYTTLFHHKYDMVVEKQAKTSNK